MGIRAARASTVDQLVLPGRWILRAACRDTFAEVFWPGVGEPPHPQAIATCNQCPVQQTCLQWAISNDEEHGIWGGHTPRERRAIAQEIERRRQAALARATETSGTLRTCSAGDCDAEYRTDRPSQRYCSQRCRDRVQLQRYRERTRSQQEAAA